MSDKQEQNKINDIKISHSQLDLSELVKKVTSPSSGAISLFVGTTRDNFDGKKVVHLEYEAYESMAENEIQKIVQEMRQQWTVEHIAIHHRLGVVPITEASVIIAVSSPHREAAIKAVQWAIDTLKARVPIWKKEVYEEGSSVWKQNAEWSTKNF